MGQTIAGGLTLLGVIGAGGAGRVYRALQHSLEREVAVKLLRSDRGRDEETEQRFFLEARAASRLSHPNVVSLFDFGQTEGELYLVMELLSGRPLRRLLDEEGVLSPTRAVALITQVCDALTAAHGQDVIHRDLKPENIFVIPGAGHTGELVKVIDFGMAKTFGPAKLEEITPTGIILGTPYAMSPEQAMGRAVDGRSDLYSLGVMLYEMLSGVRPFERDTAMNTIIAHIHEEAPRLRETGRVLPAKLERLVYQTMSKRPEDRPASAAALRTLLLDAVGGTTPAPPVSESCREGRARTNITRAPASFLGRAAELAHLESLLADGERLLTLHGAGGMGKSRLARELALTLLERGDDSTFAEAWRCELGDISTLDMFCQVVAAALGLWLEADGRDPLDLIGEALSERRPTLLILDNAEHLTETISAVLPSWLGRAPSLACVVTSRQLLRLAEERVVEVGPLALPGEGDDAESARESPAFALFEARAGAANRGFSLAGSEARAAAEIVRRLDGMPLAIELAAARARMFTASQLLARMDQRFRLLAGPTTTTGRQATLHQAIDWSWSLLTAAEQAALAQLSVFRGGFSVEAVERVVDISHIDDQAWVVDVVQALRDKSLIRDADSPRHTVEARFDLYESIREYASTQLTASREVEEVEARHAAYFLWTCGEWSEAVRERSDVELRRRLSYELENITTVFHRAMSRQPMTRVAAEEALLALLVAEPVLSWRGPVGVYLGWLDEGIGAAERAGVRGSLVTKAAHARATMLTRFGRFRDATTRLDQVIELARKQGDQHVEIDALRQLGMAMAARGRGEEANMALRHARGVALSLGSPMMICEAEKTLGVARYLVGDFEGALRAWHRALELASAEGFTYEVAVNLHNTGDAHGRRGDYEKAMHALVECSTICLENDFDRLRELNELLLACVEAVQTKRPAPLSKAREALAVARRVGNNWVLVQAGTYLGRAFIELGRLDEARQAIREALDVARQEDNGPALKELGDLIEQTERKGSRKGSGTSK